MEPSNVYVHESSYVDANVSIGKGTKIWHFSHVQADARIGMNCVLGQNVNIGRGVFVGDNCHIQNNVSVYPGVTLENGVFCGPSCVFTNDLFPRASSGSAWKLEDTLVCEGASIGANATIVCGTTLGAFSLIGSGSVVTRDVLPHALVVGVPARQIGWVCTCGARLDEGLVCPECEKHFSEKPDGIFEIDCQS